MCERCNKKESDLGPWIYLLTLLVIVSVVVAGIYFGL